MARGNRARALELLKESERLERQLWALTERLVVFTEVLQAQVAAAALPPDGGGADEPAHN